MKIHIVLIFVFGMFSSACNRSPNSLQYGSDGCHFCKMTIVDKQHAAQFMTKKGRTYNFDATECMLNHLKEIDDQTVALFLVNDFDSPGKMVDATKASYLISRNVPSPMGEYITAFESPEAAQEAKAIHKGKMFTWTELRENFEQR